VALPPAQPVEAASVQLNARRKRTDPAPRTISCIIIDPNDGTAVSAQIQRHVRYLVAIGAMRSGERLPTIEALADDLGVNPNTISSAYDVLKDDGVITAVVGHGSYIAEGARSEQLVRDVASAGLSPAVGNAKALGCKRRDVEAIVAELLDKWFPRKRRERNGKTLKE